MISKPRLFGSEAKHEIRGESIDVSSDLLIQDPGFDSIKLNQVTIQHHLVAANQIDPLLDGLHRNDLLI